jgi:hypothetical protein
MASITIKNKTTNTELEIRVFKDSISFFIKPAKHSRYWIPIGTTDEEYKKIKKLLKAGGKK